MQTSLLSPAMSRVLLCLFFLVSSCAGPGATAQGSPTAPTASTTPTLTATAAPVSRVYLSELAPVEVLVGYGSLGAGVYDTPEDKSHHNRPIESHGTVYRHGLMAHAQSEIAYQLDGQFLLLTTQILLQEGMSCGDGVVFRVVLDGREVYASSPVTSQNSPETIELIVANAAVMRLIADRRTGEDCDWAIWGDPVLTRQGGGNPGFPTATPAPSPTPLGPDAPCADATADDIYLYLSCEDIRRIRQEIQSGDRETQSSWNALRTNIAAFVDSRILELDPTYDAYIMGWEHFSILPRELALAYLVTGDEAYGEAIRDLLRMIKDKTPSVNHVVGYTRGLLTLSGKGAVPVQALLMAYLTVRESSLVSDEQRAEYDAFFKRQATLYEELGVNSRDYSLEVKRTLSNYAFAGLIASATISFAFREDRAMAAMYQRNRERLDTFVAEGFEADGGWNEASDAYGFRVLDELMMLAETLLRSGGENLYVANPGGRTINSMCRFFLAIATPEGDNPALNDAGTQVVDPGLLRLCGMRTGDPDLLFAADYYTWGYYHSYGHQGRFPQTLFHVLAWADRRVARQLDSPSWRSVALPDTGVAVLRSDWSHDAQYGLLLFSHSRIHHHWSFGELYLYSDEPRLGTSGYHLGPQYDYSLSTAVHSTLSLDRQNQTHLGGELGLFAPLRTSGMMSVSGRSYSDFLHTRSVFWFGPWHTWIIVDDAAVSQPGNHQLQLRWYVDGHKVSQGVFANERQPKDLTQIVVLPGSVAIEADVARVFGGDALGEGMEVDAPLTGISTRLVTAIMTYNDIPASFAKATRSEVANGTMIHLLAAEGQLDCAMPLTDGIVIDRGISLDGFFGCIWKSADALRGIVAFNSSRFSDNDSVLFESDVPISLEAEFGTGDLEVLSESPGVLILGWPSAVSSVVDEDGGPIEFRQIGSTLSVGIHAGAQHLVVR